MPADANSRRIATTRWSVVLAAGGSDTTQARVALATLCESYWYPVYAFIRRTGHSCDDARDLTQEFFARVLEKGYLRAVRPDRGRFRSFLLTSLRHFLANERDWRHAAKRGGGKPLLPLEFDDGERRYQFEPTDELTPERIYERRWASAVLETAMQRLEESLARAGRERLFKQLKPFVFDEQPGKYESLARELDMTEGALRVSVHRLRRQFGLLLREVIAETVDPENEVDDELHYLLDIVSRGSPSR